VVVVAAVIAACGGQTRTVTVTTPQATSTPSPVSAPATTTSTSATTCPPGMATNRNGELVNASQGAYGPHCQQIAARILAKAAQAQAQAEDNACGGRGPGACGQSGSSNSSQATTQTAGTQTTALPSCPNGYMLVGQPNEYTCTLVTPTVMVSCPNGQVENIYIGGEPDTCGTGGTTLATCPPGYQPDQGIPNDCISTKPEQVPPTG
jgi:hypothetical protein